MVLLRRRNWTQTVLLACATVLAYAACVFWARAGFMEKNYNSKQRLWAQFLSSCDCKGPDCEEFNLNMMHSSLYGRLLKASGNGNRSVVQHLVWQPYKVAVAYPWRLRMYAHMGLVLPRSLAVLHTWWLAGNEDLAVALQHLSQGVPLALDPDSPAAEGVEPDAVIVCTLEPSPAAATVGDSVDSNRQDKKGKEGDDNDGARSDGDGSQGSEQEGEDPEGSPGAEGKTERRAEETAGAGGESDATGLPEAGAAEGRGMGPDAAEGEGSAGRASNASSGGAGGGGGGKGKSPDSGSSSESESAQRRSGRFRCVLVEARGARSLLRLAGTPPPPPPPQATLKGPSGSAAAPPPVPPPEPPLPLPVKPATEQHGMHGREGSRDQCPAGQCPTAGSEDAAGGSSSSGKGEEPSNGAAHNDGTAPAPSYDSGTCPARDGEGIAAAGEASMADSAFGSDELPYSNSSVGGAGVDGEAASGGLGRGRRRVPGGRIRGGRRGRSRGGGGAGGGRGGGPGRAAAGPARESICRNIIYIRPPHKSELLDYDREQRASPLALPPLQLLRLALPRAVELAGWAVLPHVMMARYSLLLAPPGATGEGGGGGAGKAEGGGGGGFAAALGQHEEMDQPLLHAGAQLMLMGGALLTTCELLLLWRLVSELVPLRRPHRVWARRRQAAWRVAYEGMVQPLREALLSWKLTHFVVMPLLQLGLSLPAIDVLLLLPLSYCVLVLGAANSDVAARASPALLRVARRTRLHEGGFHLLLLGVVQAAEPGALSYLLQVLLAGVDTVGNAGRAAVQAALLEEAPGVAAALAARQQAAAAAGGAGEGGELAAAMQARVAAPGGGVRPRWRGAAAAANEPYDSDDAEEDDDDGEEEGGASREGRPRLLRWPAPLQLPAEAHDWEDVPRGFVCAITQQLMSQPAMLVSPDLPSAPTYDRGAITTWLARHMRDPKSNTALSCYSLLPNEDLHRAIDDWVTLRLRSQEVAAKAAAAAAALQITSRQFCRQSTGGTAGKDDAAAGAGSGGSSGGGDGGMSRGRTQRHGPCSTREDAGGEGAVVHGMDDCDEDDGCGGGGGSGGGAASSEAGGSGKGGSPPGPSRSTSVLASLAQGASSLLDVGVEVMSRSAVAAAAAVASATGAAAADTNAGGSRGSSRRREMPQASLSGGGGGSDDEYGSQAGAEGPRL